jgi:tetratricopeptide (TPR) repeat protein
MQAVEEHEPEAAERHSLLLDAQLWRLSQQVQGEAEHAKKTPAAPIAPIPTDPFLEPLLKMLTVMSLELRGTVLAANGNFSEAKEAFSHASEKEADLGYREPPIYIRPASEGEASAWMAAKRWSEAESAYRLALKDRPHSGFALYGIALAEEQSGATGRTANAYREFLAAWKDADPDLPQMQHARQWLAEYPNSPAAQHGSEASAH